ncbi:MAG: hypothetical protein J6Z01_15080 [Bacteroidales bacterium]|nr:hypothetical protein [Bacteroidales bacterium]
MNENKALTVLAIAGAAYLAYTYYIRKKEGKTRPETVIKSYREMETVRPTTPQPDVTMLTSDQIRKLQTKLNEFRVSGELGRLIDPLFKYLAAAKEKETKMIAIRDFRISFSEVAVTGKYDDNTRIAVKALKIYLNVVKKANLVVNDNYDRETDKLTKWKIYE